ncbi:glycosyltransferase family 2 protein [Candidatus Gottesmanbacteria bacterium]|nr:glycosyltransferase family 2 protein [Candidatus Gottesmanbacteria bacterium]
MGKKITVEIVIPIYNEEIDLEANILKLHSYLSEKCSSFNWHITIADNASTDNSLTIAKNLVKKLPGVGVIHLSQKGRGRAVKSAWKKSRASILLYMDVDLSTDLVSLTPLVKSLSSGYDIAIGSRLLPDSKVMNRPLKREILSRGYNILIKLIFRTRFSDAQCGFKAVTRRIVHQLLPHIRDNAWFFDSELLIIGEKLGYKIYEEPVSWIDNPGSTVRVIKTVYGDLAGLWRLFWNKPWRKIKINNE